jgi:uncharacterized membrane protein
MMKGKHTMTIPVKTPLGLLVAMAVGSAMAVSAAKAADEKFETCFGIAKAGQNDCKSSTHICAGKGTADRDPHTFIALPAGTCAKIVGGSTTEAPPDKK